MNMRSTDLNQTSRRQRRFAALGVTAGLLGGGAIGLLAVSPSCSSAAGISDAAADDGEKRLTMATSG